MEPYDWEKPDDIMIALLSLYAAQTQDEREDGKTAHDNGVGFNGVDAPILSSFAEQILNGKALSTKQLQICKNIIWPKYRKQLDVLQRSTLPSLAAPTTFVPREKYDGTLKVLDGALNFIPNVFPSNQIKSLGFVWRSKEIGWTGKLSLLNIEGVQRLFPTTRLDPTVQEYIDGNTKPVDLSDAAEKSTLFSKQKEAVRFMLNFKRVLLGMSPGTGKTATSIFASNELKKYDDILVVCPLTLMLNWKAEIKKWLGEDAVIWHGPLSKWTPYRKWVITNYETFVRNIADFQAQSFKVAIFDESVVLKNRKTKRAESVELYTRQLDVVFLLSGSPVTRFLDDMWSQLHALDRKRFSSYWKFVEQYCVTEQSQWGIKIVGNQEDAVERLKRDLEDIYFSCSQEDIADIPDWIFDTLEVPMTKEQYVYYEQMEAEFMAELPEDDVILAPNVLSQLVRLMQFSSNPVLLGGPNIGCKWNAALDVLEYEELPAIIWTQFIHTADLLSNKLKTAGYSVERLTGETEQSSRQDIVDRFQNGKIDVIVAHPAVGKYGLTLTRARTVIYLERSFNGDDYIQSLYRVKRIGTQKSPHVILLLATRPDSATGTIDHVIDQVLEFRKNTSLQMVKASVTSGLIREILGKTLKGR